MLYPSSVFILQIIFLLCIHRDAASPSSAPESIYENEEQTMELKFDASRNNFYELFIFQVYDSISTKQKIFFDPKQQPNRQNYLNGPYFSLIYTTTAPGSINVTTKFTFSANHLTFDVFHLSTDDIQLKTDFLKNTAAFEANRLRHSEQLTIQRHWRLRLTQMTFTNKTGGMLAFVPGIIKCRASGGYPDASVTIVGIDQLKVISRVFDRRYNTETATVVSTLDQRDTRIGCRAGGDFQYDALHLFGEWLFMIGWEIMRYV